MNDLSVSLSSAASLPPHANLPEAPAKVTARNLNFYYGDHHALKDINLTLGTNRVTAFIGPSGCGKSTLLRIFNRMYDLYPGQRATGHLLLDNTNILDPRLDLNLLRARVPASPSSRSPRRRGRRAERPATTADTVPASGPSGCSVSAARSGSGSVVTVPVATTRSSRIAASRSDGDRGRGSFTQ